MSMIGEAVARLGLDKEQYTRGLESAGNAADKFAQQVSGQLMGVGKILAGAFTFDKIISGFQNAINKGAQLGELADRFGIASSSLQKIGNVASVSGSSIEDVANAMNRLAKNAGAALGGNEKLQQTFERIGVSMAELRSLNPEQLFMRLADAVKSGSLGSQDFAVAMELAGKNAANLMNTLREGSTEIDRAGTAMGVYSDQTVENLKKAEDAITVFQTKSTIAFGLVLDSFLSLASEIKNNPMNLFDWEKMQLSMEASDRKRAENRSQRNTRTLGSAEDQTFAEPATREKEAKQKADSDKKFRDAVAAGLEMDAKEAATDEGIKFRALMREAMRKRETSRQQEIEAARQTEEMNLNTMQIVEAQSALDEAEQKKREIDRRVTETDAAAAKIAQGVFGSARGPGQRMTSMEIGINRAVDRAFNQQTIKSSREYRDQIKAELGPGADGYAVNREIQKRRVKDAEEKAKAPFEAAKAAKDQQTNILKYMQSVQDILNELKAYAHAT
jgi:uncharacterized protein YkuJ